MLNVVIVGGRGLRGLHREFEGFVLHDVNLILQAAFATGPVYHELVEAYVVLVEGVDQCRDQVVHHLRRVVGPGGESKTLLASSDSGVVDRLDVMAPFHEGFGH